MRYTELTPLSSTLCQTRRKLGDEVDLLSVTPDAQRQPGSGRLPADDFDQIVRISSLQAGRPHHEIPGFQAGNLGHAIVGNPVDARCPVARYQYDAELRPV